ncbi:hypothetical protein C8F01DRAFT_1120242 [Mycena amicta]|nr:hypothetical protein C8F01DRAFT_1120242 [Mycena amicta]
MPTISARLDSSPVVLRSPPPRLKRSVSVASSLPTPPRTVTKRKRKRRSLHSDEEELSSHPAARRAIRCCTGVSSKPVRRHISCPFSPPPSHRKSKPKQKARLEAAIAAGVLRRPTSPTTPPAKRRKLELPRDELNNPFLAMKSKWHQADTPSAPEEKPTMTFVFRGVRREFPNPYYDEANAGAPPKANPKSQLPPEHADFEPDERGIRKLLFKVKKHATQKSGSPSRRAVDVARGKSAVAAPKAAAEKTRVALKAASHKTKNIHD